MSQMDDVMARAWGSMTEQERRERLHKMFEWEGRYLVGMSAEGVTRDLVSPNVADDAGYMLGFTPEEVRAERFEWQQAGQEGSADA